MKTKLLTLLFLFCLCSLQAHADAPTFNKAIGLNVIGMIPLADTHPVLDPGIGGGIDFDFRFSQRYALNIETFVSFQDGSGTSRGEGNIMLFALPATTFKMYLLSQPNKFDPYFGLGIGFYFLTEGSLGDSSSGAGLGAQIAVGFDYALNDRLSLGFAGTYRSIGILNSFSGAANASMIMPYTLSGKIQYHF